MDNRNYYLYKITNLINGKLYIGVTAHPDKRERQHLYEKPKKGKVSLIKNAAMKYGAENFKFEIICVGQQEYIYDLERKAIDLYDTINCGYNLTPGGLGGLGKKIRERSDDYTCYVSGFWFPNKRVACKAMNITSTTIFYAWKKLGILGDVSKPQWEGNPVYFKGFWFDNVKIAGDVFSKTPDSIRQSVGRGAVEENCKLKTKQPKRKPVINGVTYEDLKSAANALAISYSTIIARIYKQTLEVSYEYTTN